MARRNAKYLVGMIVTAVVYLAIMILAAGSASASTSSGRTQWTSPPPASQSSEGRS